MEGAYGGVEAVSEVEDSVGREVVGMESVRDGRGKVTDTETQSGPEQLGDTEAGGADSETKPKVLEVVNAGSGERVVEELNRPRDGSGRLAETERQSRPEHIVDALALVMVVNPEELEISVDGVGRGTLAVTDMQSGPVQVAKGVELPVLSAGNEDDVLFIGNEGAGSPVDGVGRGKMAETDKHSRPVHDVDGDGVYGPFKDVDPVSILLPRAVDAEDPRDGSGRLVEPVIDTHSNPVQLAE